MNNISIDENINNISLDRHRCVYCLSVPATTREHIIPKQLMRYNKRLKTQDHNVAHCCYECNQAKRHKLILPTPWNLKTAFVNVPDEYIYHLARWVYWNKDILNKLFSHEKLAQHFEVNPYHIDMIATLFKLGYYDNITPEKRGSNNFIIDYIALTKDGNNTIGDDEHEFICSSNGDKT